MATRPAPGKKNQPPVAPAAKVGVGGSSKPPTTQVKPPTTQVKPPTTQPTTKTGQGKGPQAGPGPKPAGNPGPGREWKVVNGKWQAVRKTFSGGGGGQQGGQQNQQQGGQQNQQPQVDQGSTGTTEETVDVPKTEEDIRKEVESKIGESDILRGADYTRLMSDLGFGLGSTGGGGYASFADVFKSGTFDPSKFTLRDAMGRAITPDNYEQILGGDILGPEGVGSIAGTAIGDLIRSARQSGAEEAEGRASGGISSGSGVAGAQAAARRAAGSFGIENLRKRLLGGVADIQTGRSTEISDIRGDIEKDPASVVKTTPGAAPTVPKPPVPTAPKTGPGKKKPPGMNIDAKDLPANPKKGDAVKGKGGVTWTWNGSRWVRGKK